MNCFFSIDLTQWSRDTYIGFTGVIFLFIGAPVLLAYIEHRITKKNKAHGIYFLLAVSIVYFLLSGILTLLVTALLLIVYYITQKAPKTTQLKEAAPQN